MNPITIAVALTCPDPVETVADAEQAVVEARFEDVEAAAGRATEAFACGPAAEPTLLARLWNAQGAALVLQGDDISGAIAFRSAARTAPGVFDARFGEELRQAWQAAAQVPGGEGALSASGPVDGVLAVDGAPTELPATVADGLHVVQALAEDGIAWHAESVFLPAGESLSLQVPPRPAQVADATPRRRFPVLLVAGGAGLVLGGASVVGALAQDGAMTSAGSVDDLDGAYRRQKLFGYAAYPLLGLGATGVALHFVL